MKLEWNRVTWYSKLGAFTVLILTVLLAFYFLNEYQEIQNLKNSIVVQEEQASTQDIAISGRIVELDINPMFADGNAILRIKTTDKGEFVVEIPSGERLCAADLSSFNEVVVGDEVRVTGKLKPSGIIIPCESPEHVFQLLSRAEYNSASLEKQLCEDTGGIYIGCPLNPLPNAGLCIPCGCQEGTTWDFTEEGCTAL